MMNRFDYQKIIDYINENGGITLGCKGDIVEKLDEWCFPRWPELTAIVTNDDIEQKLRKFIADNQKKITSEYFVVCGSITMNTI